MRPNDFSAALSAFASGVTLVTVRDGRDDIGATVSAFCPVSFDPPLVLVSVMSDSYMDEVLDRTDRFAVTLLAESQRALAGRFAAAGRPSARLLLANTPHRRGPLTDALVAEGGLAALECETNARVPAGDHTLFIAKALDMPYVQSDVAPLIRFRGRYPTIC